MRICLLAYRGNPYSGGQGVYLYQLTRALVRQGHEVEVIVGPPYPRDLTPWARVHRVPALNLWGVYRREWLPPGHPWGLFRPWNLFDFALTRLRFFPEPLSFSFRSLGVLAGLLRQRSFDVLHDVQTLGYGTLAMKAFGLPLLTTVHHPLTIDRREALARGRTFEELYHTVAFYPVAMQGFVIRRLERIITASQAGLRAIARDFRVPAARISVVPGGLDTERMQNPGNLRRRPATLLFVGNTDDGKKGIRHLLQALVRLPAAVRLRIVDDPYPVKKLAHEECERLGLSRRVTFLGKLDEVSLREEYCRCTLLVQPSLYEGFGLPAAEALACRTPVVATAVGAVPEVVTPETGVLVAPGDAGALAGAIETLLDDPRRRGALGEAGRMRMVRRFDWNVTAAHTARVYRQTIGDHHFPPEPGAEKRAESTAPALAEERDSGAL